MADPDRCRCGALRHATDAERCTRGHPWRGNMLALVAGARSVQFWREHDAERVAIAAALITDAGHTPDDAPHALRIAADTLAMATLLQRSAYLRVVEAGGPMSGADRMRRCYHVWESATDRVASLLRLVGLRRTPKPETLADWFTADDEHEPNDDNTNTEEHHVDEDHTRDDHDGSDPQRLTRHSSRSGDLPSLRNATGRPWRRRGAITFPRWAPTVKGI